VDEVVAAAALNPRAVSATVDSMASAAGNATQLLDVDMNQFARHFALIAADQATSWAVQPVKPVKLVAAQELVTS